MTTFNITSIPKIKTLIVFSLIFIISSCITKTEIDLIVHNAKIYSLNDNNDLYEAVAVNNGEILAIGKNNQILNKYKAKSSFDLSGNFVYPGFIDAHCHFLAYGLQKKMVDLSSAKSFNEIIKLLKENSTEKEDQWIIGFGWDQNKWETTNWPTNKELSSNFKTTNVVLQRIDGHAIMANQKAILTAKVNMDTIVDGGYIELINHNATGLLLTMQWI